MILTPGTVYKFKNEMHQTIVKKTSKYIYSKVTRVFKAGRGGWELNEDVEDSLEYFKAQLKDEELKLVKPNLINSNQIKKLIKDKHE